MLDTESMLESYMQGVSMLESTRGVFNVESDRAFRSQTLIGLHRQKVLGHSKVRRQKVLGQFKVRRQKVLGHFKVRRQKVLGHFKVRRQKVLGHFKVSRRLIIRKRKGVSKLESVEYLPEAVQSNFAIEEGECAYYLSCLQNLCK